MPPELNQERGQTWIIHTEKGGERRVRLSAEEGALNSLEGRDLRFIRPNKKKRWTERSRAAEKLVLIPSGGVYSSDEKTEAIRSRNDRVSPEGEEKGPRGEGERKYDRGALSFL